MGKTSLKKQPLNIFYSYAHEDKAYQKSLSKYLASLRRDGQIKEWFDGNIRAGDEFEQVINKNIYIADIIFLIISIDFINSDYCWQKEMPEALKLHENKRAKVIPIIIRPISIEISGTPFVKLKMLPEDGKPVTKWTNRESGWINVAKSIGEVVSELYVRKKKEPKKTSERIALSQKHSLERKPITLHLDKKVNSVKGKVSRIICDAQHKQTITYKIVRKEGDQPIQDSIANAVYDNLGKVYDFFFNVYGRNSADDKGVPVTCVIHYGKKYGNAFWDGRNIVIGDGDETLKELHALDIIANEFTKAINQYERGMEYWGQSGSIVMATGNIFGSLVKQYYSQQTAQQASWIIGENMLVKKGIARGLYSLSDPGTAYYKHPFLHSDPNKASVRDMNQNKETMNIDSGNLHENCGIPGRAFYLAASMIEGYAWEKAGKVWYEAFLNKTLKKTPTFVEFAKISIATADRLYTSNSIPSLAFRRAWELVGVEVSQK